MDEVPSLPRDPDPPVGRRPFLLVLAATGVGALAASLILTALNVPPRIRRPDPPPSLQQRIGIAKKAVEDAGDTATKSTKLLELGRLYEENRNYQEAENTLLEGEKLIGEDPERKSEYDATLGNLYLRMHEAQIRAGRDGGQSRVDPRPIVQLVIGLQPPVGTNRDPAQMPHAQKAFVRLKSAFHQHKTAKNAGQLGRALMYWVAVLREENREDEIIKILADNDIKTFEMIKDDPVARDFIPIVRAMIVARDQRAVAETGLNSERARWAAFTEDVRKPLAIAPEAADWTKKATKEVLRLAASERALMADEGNWIELALKWGHELDAETVKATTLTTERDAARGELASWVLFSKTMSPALGMKTPEDGVSPAPWIAAATTKIRDLSDPAPIKSLMAKLAKSDAALSKAIEAQNTAEKAAIVLRSDLKRADAARTAAAEGLSKLGLELATATAARTAAEKAVDGLRVDLANAIAARRAAEAVPSQLRIDLTNAVAARKAAEAAATGLRIDLAAAAAARKATVGEVARLRNADRVWVKHASEIAQLVHQGPIPVEAVRWRTAPDPVTERWIVQLVQSVKRSLPAPPPPPDASEQAQRLFGAGSNAFFGQDYSLAFELFDQAITLNGENALYYDFRGMARQFRDLGGVSMTLPDAAADMRQGYALERRGKPDSSTVNQGLTRIQFETRAWVDAFRGVPSSPFPSRLPVAPWCGSCPLAARSDRSTGRN